MPKYPPNYQTTSTQEKISPGPPADMPDRGGSKPSVQSTSSMVPLGRTEHHVAYQGAHPGMGSVQSTSTKATISRSNDSPYGPENATTPQSSMRGKK